MPTLAEWTARWSTFQEKLTARVDAVRDEVVDAFAAVADASPLDPTPIYALDGMVQARFSSLGDKLDAAFDQVDSGLDALLDDEERASVIHTVAQARDRMVEERQGLARRIDRTEHESKVRGAAVVGRVLQALAADEDPTWTCVQCGAPFDPGVVTQSTSHPCPGCGARVTVGPRPAALQWYSRGAAALAEERALDAWFAYREAEVELDALRHPTMADLDRLSEAYDAYNQVLYGALTELHPGWTVERATAEREGRLSQLRSIRLRFGQQDLERTGEGLAAARRGPDAVRRWAAATSPSAEGRHLLLSGLLEAALERGEGGAAEALVQVVYADEMPPWSRWFGAGRWARTRVRSLTAGL